MHLSFPLGESINNGIDKKTFTVKYASFNQAVSIAQRLSKSAEMAKSDIKISFPNAPYLPGDFELLGFKFQGLYFIDKCLPM